MSRYSDSNLLSRVLHHVVCALLFLTTSVVAYGAEQKPPDINVGSWIWCSQTYDRQECRFVRSFIVPWGEAVRSARFRITADNSYEVFLDGQPIGRGGDWRSFIEYDLKLLLTPGEHVLAISALNDFDLAGMICGLRIEMGDGQVTEIVSDESWKIAPNQEYSWKEKTSAWNHWPAATVLYAFPAALPKYVYYAPRSRPVAIGIWQQTWFQTSLLAVMIASLAGAIFLASRLIVHSQLETVIHRERARIAQDLHDGVGGGLTQLVVTGEKARLETLADTPEANALANVCAQSRGLVREMNETVWLINSQRDNFRDFASYVVKYAETFFQNSPIRCRFDIEDDLPPLPCDLGTRRNLFLAVKEALNNILRHSQASVAEISIHRQRQNLVVKIRDDGQGFDPRTKRYGNGLRNMQNRATEAGVQFTAVSSPGFGTTVEFVIPLHAPRRFNVTHLFPWKRNTGPA